MIRKGLNWLIASTLISLLLITTANAEYLGCFSDNSHRDLSGTTWNNPNLTTESCVKFCSSEGFSYAGTQFGTQCFCGNNYGNYGQSNDCNVPCAGNTSQICGGAWTNSIHSVSTTSDSVSVDAFTPFAGKTWVFNSERSYDEITFDAKLTDDTLFGLDTNGQLWGIDYDAEDGQYMVIKIEMTDKTNAFSYRFSCNNCTNITGQYLVIYDINSDTQTIEGPYSASGQLVANTQYQTEALTIFAGETWVFSSDRSLEEITFDPTLHNEDTLFGVDTKDQLWGLVYSSNENLYLLISVRELNGKTDTFSYFFTCTANGCNNVTGDYLIVYDYKSVSETSEGPYSATGQLKGSVSDNTPPPSNTNNSYPALGSKAVDAFNNPIGVNSTLNGGISVNGGVYLQRVEQRLSDSVDVSGTITVDPTHVGNTANIFVYAKVSLPSSDVYYMLNENLDILAWDLNPASLVAYRRNVQLTSVYTAPLYSGTFIYPGTLEIFFGYQLTDGTLISNNTPIVVTIY